MEISNQEYFSLFTLSYVLVGVLTPIMRKIAILSNIVDKPNSIHKSHKQPVPYLGGVAIIVGILTVSYSVSIFSNFTSKTFWLATSVLGPALILGLIGLWDDMKNLKPLPRFLAQSSAGIFTATLLIITNTVGNPTSSPFFDSVFTILWVVGICNAINFFDNIDGGAAGTVAISSLALAYLALNSNQFLIASLAVVTAGATLGFLVWNKSPAKIYMGDAGALFLGVLLATLTIRLKPDAPSEIGSFLTPVFLIAVPILDTSIAVISRLRRHVSPFQGGQDHLSHRLIRNGVSRKFTALLLWALSGFFAVLAILINVGTFLEPNFLVILGSLVWILLFMVFLRTKDV